MSMAMTSPEFDHTSADGLFSRGAHIFLKRNNSIELSANPALVRSRSAAVMSGMRTLTEDPDLRSLFPWHTHIADTYGPKYEQEAGLKHDQNDGENKFVFQYIRGAAYGAEAQARYGEFLTAVSDLDTKAREYALGIAECIDTSYGRNKPYSGSLYERIHLGTSVTRVLRYLPTEGGSSDAYPHIDRSLITIHWKASHQGLYIFLPDGSKVRIKECSNDAVCAFFGRKYIAATQQIGNGCPHGVRYDRKPGEDRYSIVTFVHPAAIDSDVLWLLAHDADIKAKERQIKL